MPEARMPFPLVEMVGFEPTMRQDTPIEHSPPALPTSPHLHIRAAYWPPLYINQTRYRPAKWHPSGHILTRQTMTLGFCKALLVMILALLFHQRRTLSVEPLALKLWALSVTVKIDFIICPRPYITAGSIIKTSVIPNYKVFFIR